MLKLLNLGGECIYCTIFSLKKNSAMKKSWRKMSQKNFIPNTLSFLFFQYFLVGRRWDVRVPATYFEKELRVILIYTSVTARKPI